jgi:hypothetical protein
VCAFFACAVLLQALPAIQTSASPCQFPASPRSTLPQATASAARQQLYHQLQVTPRSSPATPSQAARATALSARAAPQATQEGYP